MNLDRCNSIKPPFSNCKMVSASDYVSALSIPGNFSWPKAVRTLLMRMHMPILLPFTEMLGGSRKQGDGPGDPLAALGGSFMMNLLVRDALSPLQLYSISVLLSITHAAPCHTHGRPSDITMTLSTRPSPFLVLTEARARSAWLACAILPSRLLHARAPAALSARVRVPTRPCFQLVGNAQSQRSGTWYPLVFLVACVWPGMLPPVALSLHACITDRRDQPHRRARSQHGIRSRAGTVRAVHAGFRGPG